MNNHTTETILAALASTNARLVVADPEGAPTCLIVHGGGSTTPVAAQLIPDLIDCDFIEIVTSTAEKNEFVISKDGLLWLYNQGLEAKVARYEIAMTQLQRGWWATGDTSEMLANVRRIVWRACGLSEIASVTPGEDWKPE